MRTKLKDALEKVRKLENKSNSDLLIEFYEYLRSARTAERYQSYILKVLVKFSEFINDNLMNIQKKEQIIPSTFSPPYVPDWLNEHPCKNELNARLVCNLTTD